MNLPDIQKTEPTLKIPIKQVGVEGVEVPFRLERRPTFKELTGEPMNLYGLVSMRTNVPEHLKGISMSRFLRTLGTHLDKPLKRWVIQEILKELQEKVGSDNSFMKFEFKLPRNKKSPLSSNSFPIYYPCRFEGQYQSNLVDNDSYEPLDNYRFFQGVRVQYAAYCPCSAELCMHLYEKGAIGFPHNQRAFADILVESDLKNYVWLEDIIDAVENGIKTLPYPIIKRNDEQEIARVAAENPLFVEDAIRIISKNLSDMPVKDWIVKCTHEESIHTSNAIAINWKGIDNGFDGRRFI
jgi:GTP cyclohydrolase I